MNILTQAKADWERFSQSAFELDCIFKVDDTPGAETATIQVLKTDISVDIESDGQDLIGSKVRLTFSENLLKTTNPAYPIRNSDNLVAIKGQRISVVDSTGTLKEYVIKNVYPDSTVGMIVCDLAEYITHPEDPQDMVISNVAATSFTGTITSNSNSVETGFQWEISLDNFVSDITVAGTTLTNIVTFDYTGLTTATEYFVRAKALGGVDSGYTTIVSQTTS